MDVWPSPLLLLCLAVTLIPPSTPSSPSMHILIVLIFVLGYLSIAFEHKIRINKAASALLIGVLCWSLYVTNLSSLIRPEVIPTWFTMEAESEGITNIPLHFAIDAQHLHQTGEIASILFFLMGAMTIVELVDSHEAFAIITDRIRTTDKRTLLWTVGVLTFFLSAALDNLTTTIVMHKVGTIEVMKELFVGSLVCLIVPLIGFSYSMPGKITVVERHSHRQSDIQPWHQWLFLLLGLTALLGVPMFKTLTHLPPYMGMML